VALFRENESRLNDAHRKYLTICERLVAACYCHLYHFIELHSGETIAAGDDHVKKLAHEFHYNAPYELRTPVSALKAYYEPRILASMGVSSTPFLPENQDRLDQISSWVGELWKFVDDLPGCGSLMSGRMQPDQVPPCRYFGRHDPGRPC
jgi:hypothetical protein